MNTLFNPEIARVVFDLCNEEESNDNASSSRVPRTRRVLSRDHVGSTNEYLRRPTSEDVQRLVNKHEQIHSFPGQYTRGDKGHPTIMLEAVASYDLWIWHAYFGPAGSNNDINVLNETDLFKDLLQDRAPALQYTVNGEEFTKGYYLADGIYPEWATLVKSFKSPMDPKSGK
uniref:uncharacterized protein LOC122601185 n=1 Tax=Erigeron canadensis TaxID=72917 RepID=UPI001CB912AF|nr:uncharacterized protein LOC122601185 [Erigeron canadensis]